MNRTGAWVKFAWPNPLYTRRRLTRYCIERLGLPESDLRRFRYFLNFDACEVETWNRRRLHVTGREVHAT